MSIINFKLPFPPSVNSRYGVSKGRRFKSNRDKAWIELANQWINNQNIIPFKGRCYLALELCHPDNRPRDAANYEKKTTDLLVSREILPGDERRYLKGVFSYWNDKPGDYIIVKIIPVEKWDHNFLDSL